MHKTPENNAVPKEYYEAIARANIAGARRYIVPVPDGVQIAPELLGDMSNQQFVEALRMLQELVIRMYIDMERAPFEWGFPDFQKNKEYTDYGRAYGVLVNLVRNGVCRDGVLTVDAQVYLKTIKKHKKIDLMFAGFERLGISLEKFDKNSQYFAVTYPSNPRVITVFDTYVKSFRSDFAPGPYCWEMGVYIDSLSYRFVEVPQKYPASFLAVMDATTDAVREVQYWLYDEAAKYGYTMNPSAAMRQGCIWYKKGSKNFLAVGETRVDGIESELGTVSAKITFRKAFERAPEKADALAARFPEVFKSNCQGHTPYDQFCQWRIPYKINGEPHWNCTYRSFVFRNLTLDDVKLLLEFYLIEHNIM